MLVSFIIGAWMPRACSARPCAPNGWALGGSTAATAGTRRVLTLPAILLRGRVPAAPGTRAGHARTRRHELVSAWGRRQCRRRLPRSRSSLPPVARRGASSPRLRHRSRRGACMQELILCAACELAGTRGTYRWHRASAMRQTRGRPPPYLLSTRARRRARRTNRSSPSLIEARAIS